MTTLCAKCFRVDGYCVMHAQFQVHIFVVWMNEISMSHNAATGHRATGHRDTHSFKPSTKQLGMWWVLVKKLSSWPLEGDSGWVPVPCRHQFEMLKLWHRLATMDDSWLNKKVVIIALANKGKSSWCFHVKKLLTDINLGNLNPENVTCKPVC